MNIVKFIIGLGSLVVAFLGLYDQIDEIWFFIFTGLILIGFVTALIINVRDRIRRNSTLRLGLEWLRLHYDIDDSDKVRVSYFSKSFLILRNTARSPLGTPLTSETFWKGEGFAGLLWERNIFNANTNYLLVNDLPAVAENEKALIEWLKNEGVRLKTEKVLRFKSDIRSYLILAVSHPVSNRFLGVVCLDSKEGYSFASDDDLFYAKLIVDKMAKSLYDKGVDKRRA